MKLQVENLGKVAITVDNRAWSISRSYDRLVVVHDPNSGVTYISRKPVPKGTELDKTDYWIPLGRYNTSVSINKGTVLANINQLPNTESDATTPFIVDGVFYIWVGEGGDTKDGKYQSFSIKGEKGDAGKSAYEIYKETGGSKEADEWITSLKGEQGDIGPTGASGKSAYELYVQEGGELSLEDWIASLPGHSPVITIGNNGNWFIDGEDTGKPSRGTQGIKGADGKNGTDGHSPVVTIGADGYWYIDGVNTGKSAKGEKGDSGSIDGTIYINEEDWTLRIPVEVADTPGIPSCYISPAVINLTSSNPDTNIYIKGENLTSGVSLIIPTSLFEFSENNDSYLTLTADVVNKGITVNIKVYDTLSMRATTTSVICGSTTNEFTEFMTELRYVVGSIPIA